MDTLSYKTISLNKATVQKEWVVVDATDQVMGRFCAKVAKLLRGKYKPGYTPHVDCGDNVIIINASKVKLTGNHPQSKKNYYNVSGYNGGLRTRSSGVMLKEYPVEMMERAVWGMLPKGPLGRQMIKKLHVYADDKHEQSAQKPVVLDLSK